MISNLRELPRRLFTKLRYIKDGEIYTYLAHVRSYLNMRANSNDVSCSDWVTDKPW